MTTTFGASYDLPLNRLCPPEPYEFLIVHSLRGYTAVCASDGQEICTMENEQSLIAFLEELDWKLVKLYAEELK